MNYRVIVFKRLEPREIYGARCFNGPLALVCRRLVKMFGREARVKRLWPGAYSVADGLAEVYALGGDASRMTARR